MHSPPPNGQDAHICPVTPGTASNITGKFTPGQNENGQNQPQLENAQTPANLASRNANTSGLEAPDFQPVRGATRLRLLLRIRQQLGEVYGLHVSEVFELCAA